MAGLPPAAYGGLKDASAAWAAGVLAVDAWSGVGKSPEVREMPKDLQELWQERAAIMAYDGQLTQRALKPSAWREQVPSHPGRGGESGGHKVVAGEHAGR